MRAEKLGHRNNLIQGDFAFVGRVSRDISSQNQGIFQGSANVVNNVRSERRSVQTELGEIWRVARALTDVAVGQSPPTRECRAARPAEEGAGQNLPAGDAVKPAETTAAWFRREDWARWCEIDSDFQPDYEHWLKRMEQAVAQHQAAGVALIKIILDPDEFLTWARAHDKGVGTAARAEFAAWAAMQHNRREQR
jgi:hypothetical protein